MEAKYKVGDTVYIKSLDWYNKNKNYSGDIYGGTNSNYYFNKKMSECCNKSAIIKEKNRNSYRINLDHRFCNWEDYMFEDIKEIRKKKIKKLLKTLNNV